MTAQDIASALPTIIGGLFLVALLLMLLALYQLRQGRRGPYWRLRRQAGLAGGRLFLASVGLFVLALALAFYSGLAAVAFRGLDDLFAGRSEFQGVVVPTFTPTPAQSATPTNTATATLTATTVPTVTLPPSATPTVSDTPAPTATAIPPSATPTPIPATATRTPTPSPTYEQTLRLTPPPGARAAGDNARLNIVAADTTLSANNTPVQPSTTFSSGVTRIYFFFSYTDMTNGAPWSRVLYRDDVPVQGQTYLWGQGGSGDGFFFFGHASGYEAGAYEVRLYIGDAEISRYPFVIE